MADFQQREGSGVLFKNKKKTEGDRQPDYRGDANVGGQILEIAAWIKDGNGGKFMSLSFKPKEDYKPKESAGNDEGEDLDVPF